MKWLSGRKGFAFATLLLVCASAAWRLWMASAVPALWREDPLGLLRTDPALIYYITERIVEGGGLPPADFRSDPRIEWPLVTDIPAVFTVGQELLVAWAYLWFGGGLPLHVVALHWMIAVASLAVAGVTGLARELTGSRAWGLLAGALCLVTSGSYRTPGYVLVREDLSYPLFALHLYLLARAARVRTAASIAWAAVAAALAIATWHAMSFVFTVEVACLFVWFLWSGQNPFRARAAAVFPTLLALVALAVPVLRSKLFLLSLPMQMLAVLWVLGRASSEAWASRILRMDSRLRRGGIALGSLAVLALVCFAVRELIAPGAEDYSHVVGMMWAKLVHLGQRPQDPNVLTHEVRLLWQGIFQTSSVAVVALRLGVLVVLAVPGLWWGLRVWREGPERRDAGPLAVFVAFAGASLVLCVLVERLLALAALVLPALAAAFLHSREPGRVRAACVVATIVAQLAVFAGAYDTSALRRWYRAPLVRELGFTLHHIAKLEPGAVATDMVTSSAVLAHTGHPVVLQPKYETRRSRERIGRFILGLYHETPAGFSRILREEFRARYLLIQPPLLWARRYEAGLRQDASAPEPWSAAFALMGFDRGRLDGIPGFELIFTSHPRRPRYRLYELTEVEP